MKIRSGFVSNSSSSSFIVVAQCGDGALISNLQKRYGGTTLVVDGRFGKTEYGWEREKSNDFGSKAIFAYIQAQYLIEYGDTETGNRWVSMLERVIRDATNCTNIEWNISTKYDVENKDHAYIDHQSASYEGSNTQMFESEEKLYNFLFNGSSYIQTCNDNDGDYDY